MYKIVGKVRLIDYAKSMENPILVLSTYSKNPFLEMIIGSTTESILRKDTPIPCIVIR
ncbi:universal stress protein [Desulfurella sp.]|uniref:universal stress protein n=1 Tax=Desulfurella sp. TaxID=1962857 RepID=UPI00257CD289|nr:universal stress protein [Desulfurella sp.]